MLEVWVHVIDGVIRRSENELADGLRGAKVAE
jgi:hypothetical protein